MSSLPPALDFPAMEVAMCEKWKREKTFEKQDELALERKDKTFTFYDGPPFATGLPHYGHILAGTIKDTVTRYAVMNGHYVSRRAGWDCHGLPVEYEIDQKLNITHRDQVLEMGIDKYNATCRGIVSRYTQEWETTINRLGRWIDFRNDYKTMDPTFMESVWWVFAELYKKDLVYQGYKVMPYSTACTTPLSNFEAGLNYKDVKDPAVVVSFPVVGRAEGDAASFIAWTTTPWTLPSNVALCVNPTMDYLEVVDMTRDGNPRFILAKARLAQLFPIMNNKKKWKPAMAAELYEVVKTYKGTDLAGLRYTPLFDCFANESDGFFQVVADAYVTDDAGTGVVHQAPAFGEDDYRVCLAKGIIVKGGSIPCPIDDNGNFTEEGVADVVGQHVKAADPTLIQLLKAKQRLIQKDQLLHSYPFCWRSDTPLIYKAVPSWFVKVESIKDKIVANNQKTYWVPTEIRTGRFHNWLSDARDWAVSRNRFWGTPIPIWSNADFTEFRCISSIDELEQLSGVRVTDLHRETVDKIEIPSASNPDGPKLKRIDEVFDCWFESGSMPYAQQHYPFENKEAFQQGFPADFIAEGLDQTRGWFYTLMVLSTALFDKPAFQNCIVNGMVLAADGQKMSKRKKNYPDPSLVINKYGADALRMYLLNSPVVRAESLKFREEGVLAVVKEVFLPLYNAFRFFLQNIERWENVNSAKFKPTQEKVTASTNPTDVWILAETQGLIKYVHEEMAAYRLYTVMPALVRFGTQLTNWYVRLNRDRLKGMATGDDGSGDAATTTEVGLQVLYNVLLDVTIVLAPFTPFMAEFLYQHLRTFQPSYEKDGVGGTTNPVMAGKSDSVHFLQLPTFKTQLMNEAVVKAMQTLQSIVELGRNVREKRTIGLRTPIKQVVVILSNASEETVAQLQGPLKKYILTELNTWDFIIVPKADEHDWVTLSLAPNFKVLGKKVGKKMKSIQQFVKAMTHEDAVKCLEDGKLEVEGEVLDANTELESKLDFSRAGDHWESAVKMDGTMVVAVDCTQDEAIITAGVSRELINAIQTLRKNAGLDLHDVVEVYFEEENENMTVVEDAVARNVAMFQTKFGHHHASNDSGGCSLSAVPLPQRFAPKWAVALKSDLVEIGNTQVVVSICRPSLALSDRLIKEQPSAVDVLSTLEPASFSTNGHSSGDGKFTYTVDGKPCTLQQGTDFWLNTASKVRDTKALAWLVES